VFYLVVSDMIFNHRHRTHHPPSNNKHRNPHCYTEVSMGQEFNFATVDSMIMIMMNLECQIRPLGKTQSMTNEAMIIDND
jgi:hypothetical protein